MAQYQRAVETFGDYFEEMVGNLPNDKTRKKLEKVLDRIVLFKQPGSKFLKKLQNSDGIFEILVSYSSNEYRLLGFFTDEDFGDHFIILNCFVKKATKDYKKEIEKAIRLRTEYYEEENEEN